MSTPQPGIFAEGTPSHRHLQFDLRPDVGRDELGAALDAARDLYRKPGGVNVVVGFGSDLWGRVAPPNQVPAGLAPFAVDGLTAAPHDLWIWVHGFDAGLLFDVTFEVAGLLAPVAKLAEETAGFVYHDHRDLVGFEDGTENPGVDELLEVATVPDGEPGAGGSHVLAQRWVHDLPRFRALDLADQEATIGRTRYENAELDPRPPTSHLGRVVIVEDGEELEIYRRSVPYGGVGEHGLFFLAFSGEPTRTDRMLRRMFGLEDGVHDALTQFTTPVASAHYFAPSVEALVALG